MANQDRPRGFEPFGKLERANQFQAGGTIYPGDLVKLDANGQVVVCAAGDVCCGAALSYATSGNSVLVADHPHQKFVAQADDATIAAQTNLNLNYDMVVGTASTLFKRSSQQVDASTGATDSVKQVRVLALASELNNAFGSKCDVVVQINRHQLDNNSEGL